MLPVPDPGPTEYLLYCLEIDAITVVDCGLKPHDHTHADKGKGVKVARRGPTGTLTPLPLSATPLQIIYNPPYNRGSNDFRYNDAIVDSQDTFRHSKWLSFMAERLRIAWKLLKPTGVIFISIDDFESAPLRMPCDDIFGESSFLCNIVWQKRYSRENREAIGDAHEYITVYAKDKQWFKEHRHMAGITESQQKAYKNPNNDPKGRWRAVPMTAQGYRPNQMYPITDLKGNVHYPPEGRCWSTVEPEFKKLLAAGRIWFGKNGNSQPNTIRYLSEVEGVVPWTWWNNEDVGHTDEAKKEIYAILGKENRFETPKPTRLMKQILKIASQKDSLILDFFAGSGTIAQATMELNAEDGGNRHFIVCTNNENNICEEVTYCRIKTVIEGIKKDGSKYSDGIDVNLKYYRTDFVSKNEEYLSDALLEHIVEMIQLEHGMQLLHSVDSIKTAIGMPTGKVKTILERLFRKGRITGGSRSGGGRTPSNRSIRSSTIRSGSGLLFQSGWPMSSGARTRAENCFPDPLPVNH